MMSEQQSRRPVLYGASNVGCKRGNNEDQFLVAQLHRGMKTMLSSTEKDTTPDTGPIQGYLLMVADGMGGHEHGEIASAVALETFSQHVFMLMPWNMSGVKDDENRLATGFERAVHNAQDRLLELQKDVKQREGKEMGTTLTAAYVNPPDLYLTQVGDSRCYLFRDGLHQLTTDQTVAQEMVDQKLMAPEEAERSPFSSILASAVGGGAEALKVDLQHLTVQDGDVLLLCSDGLCGPVADDIIGAAMEKVYRREIEPQTCVEQLIQAALDAGGPDNVTVVVGRF